MTMRLQILIHPQNSHFHLYRLVVQVVFSRWFLRFWAQVQLYLPTIFFFLKSCPVHFKSQLFKSFKLISRIQLAKVLVTVI